MLKNPLASCLVNQLEEKFRIYNLENTWKDIYTQNLVLPSIKIMTYEIYDDSYMIGTSKIGGLPDLPDTLEWPICQNSNQYMSFVAQIRCSDVAIYDLSFQFPKFGYLYFFIDQSTPHELDCFTLPSKYKVMFSKATATELSRQSLPKNIKKQDLFYSHQIDFHSDITYNLWNSKTKQKIQLTSQEQRVFYEKFLYIEREASRVLGFPDHISEADEFDEDGLLLLQLSSLKQAGMNWANANGTLYFTIDKDSLKNLKFENVTLKVLYS